MALLLDTHALLWWLAGNERLSLPAREAIDAAGAPVVVSAATIWEVAIKHASGRLPGLAAIADDLAGAVAAQGFTPLPISFAHAQRAGALPDVHRDPFDRMLVAQALVEDLVLVSNEKLFDRYGVARLW